MADNLLDKASILLTPTAYDNGSMLSIKPENGDGDFDFERNSAATRVNAQGLVENVQIISPELVSNGNFSQIGTEEVLNGNFSQEGSEIVSNSDMESGFTNGVANNYTVSAGTPSQETSIYVSANNSQKISTSSSTAIFNHNNIAVVSGTTFKASCFVRSDVSQSVRFSDYNGSGERITQTIPANTWVNLIFYITKGNATFIPRVETLTNQTGYLLIDNVSIKEVGQNWTLRPGWSIAEGKAVANTIGNANLFQTSAITSGKIYKATFEVLDYQSGNVRINLGGASLTGVGNIYSANGVYTQYIKSDGADVYIQGRSSFIGSVSNISVKEVGQDWTLGNGWSIGDDEAIFNDTTTNRIFQTGLSIISGKKYKIGFTIADCPTTAHMTIYDAGGSDLILPNENYVNGDYTRYYTATTNETGVSFWGNTAGDTFTISNISVKEITDDTNIPRINYEGFSYQDVLGSEEVVNGDFSNGLSGWSSHSSSILELENGMAKVTSSNNSGWIRGSASIEAGKTYFCKAYITNTLNKTLFVNGTNNLVPLTLISGNTYGGYITVTGNDSTLYIKGNQTNGEVSYIDNVSVKEYLGQEVVPDSGCGSWLLEGQSTNLYPYSQTVTSGGLTFFTGGSATATLTNNYSISPDGTQNALRFQATVLNDIASRAAVRSSLSTSAVMSTVSVYAKSNTNENYTMIFHYEGGVRDTFVVTPEWQRFSFSEVSDATNNVGVELRGTYTSLEADVSLWGFQFENQSYATSVIPTNGAANTRLQDIANNSGNSSLINSTEGVLYAEIEILENSEEVKQMSLNDGTTSEAVKILQLSGSTSFRFETVMSSGTNFQKNLTLNPYQVNKLALQYKADDYKVFVNGVKQIVTQRSTVPVNLDRFSFNRGQIHTDDFYGKAKAIAVYKEALTDANLRSLTYPNPVATTFDLDFDTIAEQFTFTRGSEATFVNAQGLIESTASNDAPRIDYSTGAKAFLLEPQSTNLITYSEDFSQWASSNLTLTSGQSSAITASNDAWLFTATASTANVTLSVSSSGANTLSVFAKAGTQDGIFIRFSGSSNPRAFFNLSNGTLVGSSGITSSNVEAFNDGWYRISITSTDNVTDARIYVADSTGNFVSSGNIYVQNAQLEQQSYATSYIPTSGASATRNQELCNNATPVINSEEGTLYAEISALADDSSVREIALSDGSSSNRIELRYGAASNRIQLVARSGGVVQASISSSNYNILLNNKVAVKYKANDFALWINGVKVGTDVSGNTPVGLSELAFDDGDGGSNFYGNTKGLKYYPKALADVQLEDLTTI